MKGIARQNNSSTTVKYSSCSSRINLPPFTIFQDILSCSQDAIYSPSRGVRTPYQAVGVDRIGTSSIYGRGGCDACPELRLKGRGGRPGTTSQLPGHQVILGDHFPELRRVGDAMSGISFNGKSDGISWSHIQGRRGPSCKKISTRQQHKQTAK